jgi:hypothetical protein
MDIEHIEEMLRDLVNQYGFTFPIHLAVVARSGPVVTGSYSGPAHVKRIADTFRPASSQPASQKTVTLPICLLFVDGRTGQARLVGFTGSSGSSKKPYTIN